MEGEGEREKKVAVVVVVVVVQEYHKVVARLVGQTSQSAGCVQNRHATEETSFGKKKDQHFLFFQYFLSKLEYLSPFFDVRVNTFLRGFFDPAVPHLPFFFLQFQWF